MSFLKKLGELDVLPWFQMHRWLYHLIKAMTAVSVAFQLINFGVAMVWACGIATVSTVLVVHIGYALTKEYSFNVKDTVFDTLCSMLLFPSIIFQFPLTLIQKFALVGASYAILLLLIGLLLHFRWNSP